MVYALLYIKLSEMYFCTTIGANCYKTAGALVQNVDLELHMVPSYLFLYADFYGAALKPPKQH